MPASKPQRPTPGIALIAPRVDDEATQRALDQVALAVRQLQSRAAAGCLVGRQLLTGSGVYTPTTGTTTALVNLLAGGGGGGGAGGGANVATGGGGGSGVLLAIAVGEPGIPLTGGPFSCGAGGAGGASSGGTGGTGGDSTIVVGGVTYTAKGGTGGLGIASTAGTADLTGGVGQPGSSTGHGVLYEVSANGIHGFLIAAGGTFPGDGASSPLGAGGLGAHNGGAVGAGRGFGSGGGASAAAAVGFAGAAGAPGCIVIEEYS